MQGVAYATNVGTNPDYGRGRLYSFLVSLIVFLVFSSRRALSSSVLVSVFGFKCFCVSLHCLIARCSRYDLCQQDRNQARLIAAHLMHLWLCFLTTYPKERG